MAATITDDAMTSIWILWPGYCGRVPDTAWTEVVALVAAYLIAVVTTPAGISRAVLLLPFQVTVLATPSPSVTPTNLLYNVVSTPGALYRYWRQGQTGGRLALVLITGTLPGVIAGSFIRVKLIPGPHVFALVVAAVLIPLGIWLVLSRPARAGQPDRPARLIPAPALMALAAVVGCVGGIYGIGGGVFLAPVLIGSGRKPSEVAPAALAATFVTSAGGGSRSRSWRCSSTSRWLRTGRLGSLWVSAAWPVAIPARASSPGCPMC
jgi:uncharacterized membrane protein YfcA